MEVAAALKAFVVDELLFGEPPPGFDERSPLLGPVDSLGVLRLVAFIDRRFGVRLADAEIVPETFASLEHLASIVAGRAGRK